MMTRLKLLRTRSSIRPAPRRILSLAWYIGLLCLLFSFAACSLIPTSNSPAIPKPKIGVILPMTGKAADYGQTARDGIEYALSVLKKEGKEFELIWEDDQMDTKKTVVAYRKMVEMDGVRIFMGPIGSSNVLAVAPLADQEKIVVISPVVGANEATLGHPYVYRFWPKKDNQAIPLVHWLKQKQFGNIFAISAQTDSPISALEVLQKHMSNVSNHWVTPDERDFRTVLMMAKRSGADAIFFNLYVGQFASALQHYKELGLTTPAFASNVFGSGLEIEACKNFIDEITFVSSALETPEFTAAFKLAMGKEPGFSTASAYDAMMVIAKIATARDPKYALDNVGEINYARGPYRLDAEGDPTLVSRLQVLRHGKVEDLTY